MSGVLLWAGSETDFVVPGTAPLDNAVAPNFERFDGLTPLDHPSPGVNPYGEGDNPRPGQRDQPTGQVYTEGGIPGVVGVLGGQPYPARCGVFKASGDYTGAKAPSVQHRLGVGQDNQGAAQTVQLSNVTNNPPQPSDLSLIIAGIG